MDNQQLTEIFKTEYSNLVAVLCHYYGVSEIQLAQDIVSETFYKAMKNWSHNGVPDAPKAWLRKVAQNQLNDHYRKNKTYHEKVIPHIDISVSEDRPIEITNQIIEDSQLRMIFVVCSPELNTESQLCLALRILCGFNIEEIAKALLSNKGAINKKLFRAKKAIKEKRQLETALTKPDYVSRLDNVLRVIYLLFNEGYYSSINEENIREDICWEAMRLTIFLSKQEAFEKDKIHALLALMCFHVSRLDARKSGENGDVLYHQQDRSKWNHQLIQKGQKYLKLSTFSKTISKYQLEASIAYWHTVDSEGKWRNILELYDRLLVMEYSPIIAMNRIYAVAKADSIDKAIQQTIDLKSKNNHHYFCLLAELYRLNGNFKEELVQLDLALSTSNKLSEKELIKSKIRIAQDFYSK